MRYSLAKGIAAAALSLAAIGGGAAHAESILVTFVNTTPGLGGTTDFNYTVSLTEDPLVSDNQVHVGDYFAVTDIVGYNSSLFVPVAGVWAESTPLTTTLATSTGPTAIAGDDAGVLNVQYTYIAGPVITGAGPLGTPLGALTINSDFSGIGLEGFGGRYTRVGQPAIGTTLEANTGATAAPVVPLPAAVWGGMALLGMTGGARWWKRRGVTVA